MSGNVETDRQKANNTLEQLLEGIKNQDNDTIRNLFSKKTIDDVGNLDECVEDLLCFFQGKIESYDDWASVGTDSIKEHGKIRTELQSTYDVMTSEQKYHMAIKECTVDTFNPNNVGVISVYIINDEDWKESFAYRGDGKWTPGITIEKR